MSIRICFRTGRHCWWMRSRISMTITDRRKNHAKNDHTTDRQGSSHRAVRCHHLSGVRRHLSGGYGGTSQALHPFRQKPDHPRQDPAVLRTASDVQDHGTARPQMAGDHLKTELQPGAPAAHRHAAVRHPKLRRALLRFSEPVPQGRTHRQAERQRDELLDTG